MKHLIPISLALLLLSSGLAAQHRGLPDYDDWDNWQRKTGRYTIMYCDMCCTPMYRKDGIVQDSVVCTAKVYKSVGKTFFFHNHTCQLSYEKKLCRGK
jgi:hypothetical protein